MRSICIGQSCILLLAESDIQRENDNKFEVQGKVYRSWFAFFAAGTGQTYPRWPQTNAAREYIRHMIYGLKSYFVNNWLVW